MTTGSRKAFEAWAKPRAINVERTNDGAYWHIKAHEAWDAWTASRLDALEEAATMADLYDLGTVEGHAIATCIREAAK